MLEVILNGEKLSRTQFNDSLAKQHYSFSKSKRFYKPNPVYETEFKYEVNYDLANPSLKQKELIEKKKATKQPFNASSARIQNQIIPVAPSSDTYNPKLLNKARSCSFGFGREVNLKDSQI